MGTKKYEVSVFLTSKLEVLWEDWIRCARQAMATLEFMHRPGLSVEERARRQRMLDKASNEARVAAEKLENELLFLYDVTPDIARINREGQCLIWSEQKSPS
jgi:hypothetical protein